MKHPLSNNNGTTYLQRTLTKRRTTRTPPENVAIAIARIMVKDVVEVVKPLLLLTLREERRTSMRKAVNEMTPACSIQDGNLKKLANEHMLGAREDMSKKQHFVLPDRSYNMQKIELMNMLALMCLSQAI